MASPQKSSALVKRSADTALMPPPSQSYKRIKRPATVLDEDVYTEAISRIIARDFYPGLLETQAQQEFMDAVESRDRNWIAEADRKLTEAMTPGPDGRRMRGRRGVSMTPMVGRAGETPRGWSGETPVSMVESEAPTEQKEPAVDTNISLAAFTAKYTSEDNESFNALLDKQNLKKREKNSWLWNGNKIPSGRQIAHRAREQKLLATTGSSGEVSKDQQLVLHTTLGDNRKAMVDVHRNQPKNTFMFAPESLEDTHETIAQAAENASNMGPKAVIHHNTRMPVIDTQPADLVPPSPSMSAINAAIAGRPRPTESEAGYSGSETPRVNGYAYVDAEPTPEELGIPIDEPELPDSATLLSRLGPGDASPNPFKINEKSRREDLHHRLVEKSAIKKRMGGRLDQLRDGLSPVGRTPTPRFPSAVGIASKRGNLTPAQQRLFEKVGTPVRRSAFDVGRTRGGETPVRTPVGIKRK